MHRAVRSASFWGGSRRVSACRPRGRWPPRSGWRARPWSWPTNGCGRRASSTRRPDLPRASPLCLLHPGWRTVARKTERQERPPPPSPNLRKRHLPAWCAGPHGLPAHDLGALPWRASPVLRVHDLGYGAASGIAELRAAILAHVSVTRGVVATPDQVLVVPSTDAAIDLIARLLLRPGAPGGDAAWIEEPGYPMRRRCFGRRARAWSPCRVMPTAWTCPGPPGRCRGSSTSRRPTSIRLAPQWACRAV